MLFCFYIYIRTSGGRIYRSLAQCTVSLAVCSSSLRQKHLGITGFRRRRIIMRNDKGGKGLRATGKGLRATGRINSDLAFGILRGGDR